MWIVMLIFLLPGAQLNVTALVPLQAGGTPLPWWVGGRLLWPPLPWKRTGFSPREMC
jgi:hypothetical protein